MSKVITPILLFIVSVGLFFSYIKPAMNTLSKLREQSVRLDKSIVESEKLLDRHADLLTKYNNISSSKQKRFKQFLPDDLDAVGLIIEMDSIATKHNLNITTFEVPTINDTLNSNSRRNKKAPKKDDESPVHSASFVIECDGDYLDFKDFLLDVERSLLLLDVIGVDVIVDDITKPNSEMKTVFEVKLQTYWFK